MSIFKQTFPKWIKDQLEVRQNLQSSGINGTMKSDAALTWNQNKQCVIRATSLVNYDENLDLDLAENNSGANIEFSKLKGAALSRKFTLQGGVLKDGKTGGIRNGRFGQPESAYGDPTLGSNGEDIDGYGQVPMPGITQLDVKTKSAYGSLRQAKLSFVVHNLRQLSVMELLYMRPGYPVLVEWGWSPYIANDGDIISHVKYVTDEIDLFQDVLKQEDVYKTIVNIKKDTAGNYDAFMGFVTNFGFKARADGGFDCYSEIVSMGEALDSIKMITTTIGGNDIAFKLEETEEEIRNPDALRSIILAMGKYAGTIGTGGAEEAWTLQIFENNDGSTRLLEGILEVILEKFPPIKDLPTNEEKLKALDQYILRKLQTTEAAEFSAPLNTGYISWELFSFLLNEIAIPKASGGKPSIEIQTVKIMNEINGDKAKKPLLYNGFTDASGKGTITDISCDPRVCLLPHSFFDPTLQDTLGSETVVGKVLEAAGDLIEWAAKSFINEVVSSFSSTPDIDDFGTNSLNAEEVAKKYIGNIYINLEILPKVYEETIKGNNEGNLGEFINNLWAKINEACPLHNFVFKIDDEYTNLAYIIDLPVDNGEIKDMGEDIYVVEVQSSKSVVREYNLEAKIPDSLKSTIAVHSQGSSTAEDVDDVTFQAFNKAISNRLYDPPPSQTELDKIEADRKEKWDKMTKEQRELSLKSPREKLLKQKEDSQENYDKLKKMYFEMVNHFENTSVESSEGVVSDLKTSLKDLQSAILGLELLDRKSISTSAVIPLEFNLTFDGISNILIGCIFKIKDDKLPKGYRTDKDGNSVGFIVFSEEQSITAGQDWVTKIGGKMIMMQGGKKAGEAFGDSGKSNKQTTEKIFDKLELLPLSGVNAQTTETQQTTESTETQQIPQITKDRVFEEYLQLNRQFFSKIWARSVMIDATWGSGTTIYNSSIAKLNEELKPIVNKWIAQRPQVEAAFGLNYFDMSSAFRERWQKEEGNKVITIDINGQIRKPYLEQPQLGPDTENTFLNNIFFNQGSSDAVVEGQTLPQTPPPPTNPLPDNTSDSKSHKSNVSSMNISAEGVNAIKRFEGFRENAYQDTAGVWTIGYGTTEAALGYAVTPGMKMSKSEANTYLREHLQNSYVPTVRRYVKSEITQGEFDALVALVYNIGDGNFSTSTLLRMFNAGDHEGAANQFVRWNKVKDKKTGKKVVSNGLTTRRLAEKEIFLSA